MFIERYQRLEQIVRLTTVFHQLKEPSSERNAHVVDSARGPSWKLGIEAPMEHNDVPQESHMLMIALNVTIDDPA